MGQEETNRSAMSSILSKSWLFGVFLFLVWVPAPSSQNHYCSISKDHTLCKFQGIGPRCKNPYEVGIPAADRKQIMQMHNSLRQMVANGGERRGRGGSQPAAANMRQMEWDDELAASAQRLAEQCKYTHDCLNCRKVDRFYTGQNLYQFSENLFREGSNWEQAIMAWYDEVARFNPRSVDYFEFVKELGHYTQMLWAETYKMGCGYTYYKDGKWNRKLYVCNYGPAGNVITTEMYKRGAPCSSCPEGTFCSQQYPGLCTSSGSSGQSFFQKPSFVPQPTTRRTTTTTKKITTTTTTTTTTPRTIRTRPTSGPIVFNEIESNDLDNSIGTRFLGSGSRTQQQKVNNRLPSSTSHINNNSHRNTNIRFSKPIRTTARTTTTVSTTLRPTTTALATTTVKTTKKPFTFSPQIFPQSNRGNSNNNRGSFGNNRNVQNQINDNRISPLASGTIQVPQTQKNSFGSVDTNRFSSKPSSSFNNRLTTTNNNFNRGSFATNNSPNAKTEILRINDSPAYTLQQTKAIQLFCDFDFAKCPVRNNGQTWDYTTYRTPGFGKGYATVVESGKSSSLEIRSVMNPSGEGNVCLYFRFVNFIFGSDGGPARSFGSPTYFTVTVTSQKQARKSVEITDRSANALDWLTAKVQFTGLHSMSLLTFEVPRNSLPDNVYLAIDDILVIKGLCHM